MKHKIFGVFSLLSFPLFSFPAPITDYLTVNFSVETERVLFVVESVNGGDFDLERIEVYEYLSNDQFVPVLYSPITNTYDGKAKIFIPKKKEALSAPLSSFSPNPFTIYHYKVFESSPHIGDDSGYFFIANGTVDWLSGTVHTTDDYREFEIVQKNAKPPFYPKNSERDFIRVCLFLLLSIFINFGLLFVLAFMGIRRHKRF